MKNLSVLAFMCLIHTTALYAQGDDNKTVSGDCSYRIKIRKAQLVKGDTRHLEQMGLSDWAIKGMKPFWSGYESEARDGSGGRVSQGHSVWALPIGYQYYMASYATVGILNFNPRRHLGNFPLPAYIQGNFLYNQPQKSYGYEAIAYSGIVKSSFYNNDQILVGGSISKYVLGDKGHLCYRPIVGISGASGALSCFILYYGYTLGGGNWSTEGVGPIAANSRHTIGIICRAAAF